MSTTSNPAQGRLATKYVAAFILVLVSVAAVTYFVPKVTDHFLHEHGGAVLTDVAKSWSLTILNPLYWSFLLVVALLELRWAAREEEGMLSVGAAQDFAWLLFAPLFNLTIVFFYLQLLNKIYIGPLQSASLDLKPVVGVAFVAVLAFLLADFFMWLSHLIRHKVPAFWRFHQVHHSQTKMSVLTDNRVHFMESIISATISYMPARLLGLSGEASTALAFATVFFTGFIHANLRTNFGPLRWLTVTPQSHRVHHSVEPQHWDRNFGAVLSIWDRLFRTQFKGSNDYPAVGIQDPSFPMETTLAPSGVLRTYFLQVIHPFRMVARDFQKS
jgi:sterol desaturase/sphingolipid hydroxylase (fatty acid hydroxylase superfamily)